MNHDFPPTLDDPQSYQNRDRHWGWISGDIWADLFRGFDALQQAIARIFDGNHIDLMLRPCRRGAKLRCWCLEEQLEVTTSS